MTEAQRFMKRWAANAGCAMADRTIAHIKDHGVEWMMGEHGCAALLSDGWHCAILTTDGVVAMAGPIPVGTARIVCSEGWGAA